jgi:hypothetical protein
VSLSSESSESPPVANFFDVLRFTTWNERNRVHEKKSAAQQKTVVRQLLKTFPIFKMVFTADQRLVLKQKYVPLFEMPDLSRVVRF